MNTYLLMITFRVWVIELPVAAFNYFVLIRRVYQPRVGELPAHEIGMSTSIGYIFVFTEPCGGGGSVGPPVPPRRLCAASMPQSPSAGQAADSRAPT
ncbi:MAG TPA: hypothetical protein VLB89_07605 [Gaiellaceae bacterium]|nr:hypothetical protein [Gaiellaceae bacterium]